MDMKVVSAVRVSNDGTNGRDKYDYQKIGGMVQTARGVEYAEVSLDSKAVTPEVDKRYTLECELYVNAKKKLAMAVRSMRLVTAVAKAA